MCGEVLRYFGNFDQQTQQLPTTAAAIGFLYTFLQCLSDECLSFESRMPGTLERTMFKV